MAKINWLFQNEQGTNLNRYKAINVSTGEEITFDLFRNGNISVVGTPLNAENMNSLINAINEVYDNFIDNGNIKVKNYESYSEITPYRVSNTFGDYTVRMDAEDGGVGVENNETGDYSEFNIDSISFKKSSFLYEFKFPRTQGETLLVGRDLIDIKPDTILLNKINDNVIQQYDSNYKEKFNVYAFDNDHSEGSGYMNFGDTKVQTTINSISRPTWYNGSGSKQLATLEDIEYIENSNINFGDYGYGINFVGGSSITENQDDTLVLGSHSKPIWENSETGEMKQLATLDDISSSNPVTKLWSGQKSLAELYTREYYLHDWMLSYNFLILNVYYNGDDYFQGCLTLIKSIYMQDEGVVVGILTDAYGNTMTYNACANSQEGFDNSPYSAVDMYVTSIYGFGG